MGLSTLFETLHEGLPLEYDIVGIEIKKQLSVEARIQILSAI